MAFADEQLEAIIAAGATGVAVFAAGPQGQTELAAGVADLRTGEPVTPSHRFRIASLTKIFVAALVLRLVAEGALELDAPAAPFVEDVTVRQLLNHTSGLDDFVGDLLEFLEPWRRDASHRWELGAREELELVLAKPRLFPPGEGWAYRGANYIALKLVVEAATGGTLRKALRRYVFEPLGLRRTDLVEEPLRGDCARGYLPGDNPIHPGDGPVDFTEFDFPFYRGGGGIVSTPVETARLLRVLLGGEFLPARLREEMLDAVESDWAETDRYGLGIGEISAVLGRERSPCGPAWGHLGFAVGYVAIALSSEDGMRQVVLCANGQPATAPAVEALFDPVGRLLWHLYCGTTETGERPRS